MHTTQHKYAIHKLTLSNGCKMAYINEGEGEQTILFIHGLATYARSWNKNIEGLKDKYRCIAIDLPGNGYSDRGDFPYSMEFFAGCIYDFIHKLGLKRICIAGHSMGGQIALTLLINVPDAADKLVLCAPAGFETFNLLEQNLYHSSISFADFFSTEENSLRNSIRSSFYHYPAYMEEMIDELVSIMHKHPTRQYRSMVDGCITGMLNEPVFNKLHAIHQKILVLFGERDALIPNRLIHPVTTKHIAEAGAAQMPHATLKLIPRCGHFLQLEKAAEVNAAIDKFLGE